CELKRTVVRAPGGLAGALYLMSKRASMKRLVLIVGLLILPAVAAAQTQCVKGKPCGRTCIADNKTCHVERPAYVPAAAAESAPPDTRRAPSRVRACPGSPPRVGRCTTGAAAATPTGWCLRIACTSALKRTRSGRGIDG